MKKIEAGIDRIDMNPHHLELFYHVAKSKGVSRAVRQMPYGIQQPSVSAQVNAKLGVFWLPKIEMDSLDLIEKYVEKGFGVGLSVRVPQQKLSSKIRVLELPEFPPVRAGAIYREGSNCNLKVCRAFLGEVQRQAARFSGK